MHSVERRYSLYWLQYSDSAGKPKSVTVSDCHVALSYDFQYKKILFGTKKNVNVTVTDMDCIKKVEIPNEP